MVQANTNDANFDNDPSIQFGKRLAHPPEGEEIVISGISGAFPQCVNIDEFKENLENKIEMITFSPRTHPELPLGFGKLKDETLKKFDTGFFDIHKRHSTTLSPMVKMIMEKAYECILDAGLNPADFEGTNTGVFMGICFSESECHWFKTEQVANADTILGNLKSIVSNRLSYFLKLKGPSYVTDTACSSSAYALDAAYKAIRMGECEAALVGGVSVVLGGGCSLQFVRLGVLSPDGHCRPFDVNGTGYVRAEAASVVLLQKAKDSKRIYAQVLHMKTNCDGFKPQGITYPSGLAQFSLLKEIYFESNINPTEISYIEAHGTGTIVGDPEELSSVDDFFTPGRKSPLLVGSVKSSIGHSEAASALASIAKVILAFETNEITPNINFTTPRPSLKGVLEGRIEIVTEKTPFRDQNGLAGVSSFGFGGGNAHVVLRRNFKEKQNFGRPLDNLPRLVCVSGRTEEAVDVLLNDIGQRFDVEHIALIHNAFRKPISNHLYRGYTIVSKNGILKKSMKPFAVGKRHFCINFGGLPEITGNVLQDLLRLPLLTDFNKILDEFLKRKYLSFKSLECNNFLLNFVAQLALAELFRQLGANFETVLSHSFGKFSSAYYQGYLTSEKILECAYVITKVTNTIKINKTDDGVDIDRFSRHREKILNEFKKILPSSNGYNGTSCVPIASPEYFLDAIFDSYQPKSTHLPKNTAILEMGQYPIKISRQNHFDNLHMNNPNDLLEIFDILGRLYEDGMQLQVQKLYPNVEFPVSRGTPMISSKIKWNHHFEHFVPTFEYELEKKNAAKFFIDPNDEEWSSLQGHVVDGRNLFPATGYLYLIWSVFADLSAIDLSKTKVVFENCKFLRACTIPKPTSESSLQLEVMLQATSGNFEITEGNVPVVTGRVRLATEEDRPETYLPSANEMDDHILLNKKDIYKELRLRGYNYKGLFRSLSQCTRRADRGKIQWANDWIAFMDNMLQIKILGEDTRLLYVPTSIAWLGIDPEAQLEQVNSLRGGDEEAIVELPIHIDHNSNVISSGGVNIRGLLASSIPRKKDTSLPVLEKYQFVPNEEHLSLEQAVRVMMQIALENNCGIKVKAVELVDDATLEGSEPLSPLIMNALGDQPLVQSDVTILSNKVIECNINVENRKLKSENDCTMVIGSRLLSRNDVLQEALEVTKEAGYIITREHPNVDTSSINVPDLIILNVLEVTNENILFLRKSPQNVNDRTRVLVRISCKSRKFEWLEAIKNAMKKEQDVIVWCQNEPYNGILGFVNCLRREPDCQNVRCVFILDKAPDFDPNLPFYETQLNKNMGINVYMNGKWGTYRHLLLDNIKEIESVHCYANSTVRGDLSSIKWIEGPLTHDSQITSNECLVEIYYSALNFRDVMTASGRLNVDVITRNRREQECVQGFEFSGKTSSGRRVMGMFSQGTLATMVKAESSLLWEVPSNWTLKEAATVPVVYGTCLYALVVVGKIKPSDTVLIHSGTGGIGQAAINLCLNMGCTVFTTVGTEEKRRYIKANFPQIKEQRIGNSRDISFEQMIMKETNGRGVDIILNSLAEEKLCASVRCLAKNGKFLEIGKFDLANNNQLNLLSFKEGGSYHGVMLDKLFNETESVKSKLNRLIQKFIDSGAVIPLKHTVFDKNELEQAFRFMTTGKHMGKVLIEIRDENDNCVGKFKGLPRYFCDPSKTYVICGGLGGFGLELADWLVLRGAKNLVLTSRKGISTGYQNYRIGIWKDYGCNILVSTQNITTKSGCENLIREAKALGSVAAVFNLAVVLKDAIFPNQTEETFLESFGPKADATEYLDEVTRRLCPDLRDFVVFSSVSCGRGNAGQTNYGMSNSVMERICEKRRKDGLPALAIQWGAVGDVGLVAEMQEEHVELEIGGTLQQSISNCLQVMDVLLKQKEGVVVSSIVVAEKKTSTAGNIMETVCGILGIRDIKSVSINSTLAELGMDSMTGVEVKQTLEREYNIFLTPTEIRTITLVRIQELYDERIASASTAEESMETFNWGEILKVVLKMEEQKSCITQLRTLESNRDPGSLPRIIVFPGIEGVCELVQNLTEKMEVEAYGVNYLSTIQEDNYSKMADMLLPYITDLLRPNQPFRLVAHSVGCNVALEVASRLERLGHVGSVTFIDGSPTFLKKLVTVATEHDTSMEHALLAALLKIQFSDEETEKIMLDIRKCPELKDKLNIISSQMTTGQRMTPEIISNGISATMKRLRACLDYIPQISKLKSKSFLYKPSIASAKFDANDYELGEYFQEPVGVQVFNGTHTTILQNKDLADELLSNLLVVIGLRIE